MNRVVLYVRNTTASVAPGHQCQGLRRFLSKTDTVVGEFSDTSPGNSADRPGLQQALSVLTAGKAGVLMVVSLDRLARTTEELADLRRLADRHGFSIRAGSGAPSPRRMTV